MATQPAELGHDERHEVDLLLAAKIRGRMAEIRVTQAQLGDAVGMDQQAISKRLSGRVPFRVSELWVIAGRLGLTAPELLASVVVPDHRPDGGPATRRSGAAIIAGTFGDKQPPVHRASRKHASRAAIAGLAGAA